MASLGAVIALIVMSIGGLVLLALGGMMMIGAIIPKRNSITSWPQQQEASFQSFDQRTQDQSGQRPGLAGPGVGFEQLYPPQNVGRQHRMAGQRIRQERGRRGHLSPFSTHWLKIGS